jgi:hypothetical protein
MDSILQKVRSQGNSGPHGTERAEPSNVDIPSHDEVVIGLNLGNQILHAIHGRNTAYAGRTWADFKRAMEQLGVRDEHVLSSIEFGIGRVGYSSGYIHVEWDEHDEVEVREMSR